jgi:thioredoxin 1
MHRMIAAIVLFVSFVGSPMWADANPVFDSRPYAEAKKAAEEADKWFIVKGTAVWCGPCKQMEKTTWRDEKVVAWVKKHAIVVSLDVDKQAGIARELRINAMPTMIAFRKGKEFDRIVGMRDAPAFLGWLEGIDRGETSIQKVRERAGARPVEGAPAEAKVDIRARYELASNLVQSGQLDEATDEYAWLWSNMLQHDPGYVGVRLSFMSSDMSRLAAQHPAAKQRFTALRDQTGRALENPATLTRPELIDWLELNTIVGDPDASLAWFTRVKADPAWKTHLIAATRSLEPLLIGSKRWADIGEFYSTPIQTLESSHRTVTSRAADEEALPAETRKQIIAMRIAEFRAKMGVIYAGLLAAGRGDVAGQFAERARTLDKSSQMTSSLIGATIDAGKPQVAHVEWLKGLDGEETDALRSRLTTALAQNTAK